MSAPLRRADGGSRSAGLTGLQEAGHTACFAGGDEPIGLEAIGKPAGSGCASRHMFRANNVGYCTMSTMPLADRRAVARDQPAARWDCRRAVTAQLPV